MRQLVLSLTALVLAASPVLAQGRSPEVELKTAVAPLPEEYRATATVLAYGADGTLAPVRKGTGEMICLGDDPRDERFHVACYHRSLEAFMARGRELRAQGMEADAMNVARDEEIVSGKLRMPERPAALYSLSGGADAWNPATGEITGASPLYVVYMPFATPEETGLSTQPKPGAPWLMFPGQPRAHIMMFPPPKN